MISPDNNNDIDDSLRWVNEMNKRNKKEQNDRNSGNSNMWLNLKKLPVMEIVVGVCIVGYLGSMVLSMRSEDDIEDNNIVNAMNKNIYSTPMDE